MKTIWWTLVYTFVGLFLAIPYCYLAGWSQHHFIYVVFFAPAFVAVWGFLAMLAGVVIRGKVRLIALNFRGGQDDLLRFYYWIWWGWTVFMFLPIICHWVAFFLRMAGETTFSTILEIYRYQSPLYAMITLLVIGMAAVGFLAITEKAGMTEP